MKFTKKYKVVLQSALANKISAVKCLRDLMGFSLAEARYFVENLPQPLAVLEPENFRVVFLDLSELLQVERVISPVFSYSVVELHETTLVFGNHAPWIDYSSPVAV